MKRRINRYLNDHQWPMTVVAFLVVGLVIAVLVVLGVVARDHAPCSFFPAKDAPTRCFQEGSR